MTRRGATVLGVLLLASACNVVLGLDDYHDRVAAPDASTTDAAPDGEAGAADATNDPTPLPDAAGPDGDAGPDGADAADAATPPATCVAYCALVTQKCVGAATQYLDGPTCLAMCDAFPEAGATSFGCRAAQALQIGANPSVECPKAGPYSFGACGTERAAFCELFFYACANAGYSATCPEFDSLADTTPGAFVLDSGTGKDCRETHLQHAFSAVTGACIRAGAAPTAGCP